MEFSIVVNLVEIMLTLLAMCGIFIAAALLYAIIVVLAGIITGSFKGGKK